MAKKNGKIHKPLKNIYLCGFMCAGKTSAGRALARLLRRPFADSDELIERRLGRTINDFVNKNGLAAFRREEAALVNQLAAAGGRVVALGGGVYPSRRWRGLLERTGSVVLLTCRWPELLRRLELGRGGRPLLAGPWPRAAARAKKLYSARLPHYRRAAFALDTGGLKPAAAARLIKERLAAKEKI